MNLIPISTSRAVRALSILCFDLSSETSRLGTIMLWTFQKVVPFFHNLKLRTANLLKNTQSLFSDLSTQTSLLGTIMLWTWLVVPFFHNLKLRTAKMLKRDHKSEINGKFRGIPLFTSLPLGGGGSWTYVRHFLDFLSLFCGYLRGVQVMISSNLFWR